ncbi:winged helix-turn-helix transcriptional regulator [Cysteiniphilum halobium]|uniref:winged helix-turn-helix transcriptional regulator n=1 Tax=Cysteiniphilum halobium TaxID=2219059 RepID=UPI000E65B760|nr:winged helix-turn-helix transcriptional regulator [Cysteiniphilum halobium]
MTTFHPYENKTTEFKRELNDRLEKEVVAFLNMEVAFPYDRDYFKSLAESDFDKIAKTPVKKWGEKWGENESKVLALISYSNKISIVAIAEETGLSTSGVEKIISRLKKQGVIKRIGSAKGGYWEIII